MTTKDPKEPQVYWLVGDENRYHTVHYSKPDTLIFKFTEVVELSAYQALQAELDVLKESFEAKHEYLVKLQKQIEILRRGLGFYADASNWSQIPGRPGVHILLLGDLSKDSNGELNNGNTARETLAEADEVGKGD